MENTKGYQKNHEEDTEKNNKIEKPIINSQQNIIHLRNNTKKKSTSIYSNSKVYENMKEEMIKKRIKNINLSEIITDKELRNIYFLLIKPYKKRNRKDNLDIFLYLLKTRLKENLKSDLLHTDFKLDTLFNFISPYISGNIYSNGEIIYSSGEPAENLYLILNGNVGQYKLVQTEKSLSSEDYYLYLYEQFNYFKKTIIDEADNNFIYRNEKEYTDIDLLRKMVNINKNIYPLYSFDDIQDLQKIIIETKIYIKLMENRPRDAVTTFEKFNVPLSYLNYDKLLNTDISPNYFIQIVSRRITQREEFYIKYIGKNTEFNVKLMKYEKIDIFKPFDYFGNFELIDTRPIRNDTIRCESNFTILMIFNKKSYSNVLNTIQKEKRQKDVIYLHSSFYFKNINRLYFEARMFPKYKIDNFLKGNILINQGERINNFIFVKEGTIEASINNISLFELSEKIKVLQEFIITKAREYDYNIKDIINLDLSLNQKTHLHYEMVEGILKQRQSFVLSITDKGCFGEYEFFFDTPAFVTETVISKNGKIYFYDFESFKKINEEVHVFNEVLKGSSFSKLKSILKRMITIYNSYFKFNMKQIETKIEEHENKLKNLDAENSKENEGDFNYISEQQKHFSSPITLFKKNIMNIHNIINNNEYNKSKESLEKFSRIGKYTVSSIFSNDIKKMKKNRQNTFSQIKNFRDKIEDNIFRSKIFNLKNKLNHNIKINFSIDNSFKEKKNTSLNKKNKSNNSLKKNKKNRINIVLKTENTQRRKQFDVFLPPLSMTEDRNITNQKQNNNECFSNENFKINYHCFKNSLSIPNSINDASLGHRDKSINKNSNNLVLSNYEKCSKKNINKKSGTINIKRAQINIIKNRSKKMRLILKRKNEEDSFYDDED